MLNLPRDQAAPPTRWVVVWGERHERESYFSDKALADAYAAAHRGVVVPMCATIPWPTSRAEAAP